MQKISGKDQALSTPFRTTQLAGLRAAAVIAWGSLSVPAMAVQASAEAAPAPVVPTATSSTAAPLNPAPSAAAPAIPRLDEREPPFGEFSYSWLNGNNPQPDSLLKAGPVTGSIYVDNYYAYQFSRPSDHTIFPTTTAPRHDEFSTNLAALGLDVTGLDGPIGRLYLQAGSNAQTDIGQDTTAKRGSYLGSLAFNSVQQAAAGWHFHALHGINVEFGILPSYIGVESYLPQENWNYTHSFAADFTPYYLSGSRTQIFLTQRQKLEIWVVNGWQTLGQWHEGRAGAYLYNWRPNGRLSLTHALYLGRDAPSDGHSLREYTDNIVQGLYYDGGKGKGINSAAVSLVADIGYEHRATARSGAMGGVSLAHRTEFSDLYAVTARADYYKDDTQAVILQLPDSVPPSALPDTRSPFIGHGYTLTFDFKPSPWVLVRFEYAHRQTNIPYFSAHDGSTPPSELTSTVPVAAPATPFVPNLVRSDDRVLANITLRL